MCGDCPHHAPSVRRAKKRTSAPAPLGCRWRCRILSVVMAEMREVERGGGLLCLICGAKPAECGEQLGVKTVREEPEETTCKKSWLFSA